MKMASVPNKVGTEPGKMRIRTLPFILLALRFGSVGAEEHNEAKLGELQARLGHPIWSAPKKHFVRATIYKMGPAAADGNSKARKSNEKVRLHYATAQEVGTVAAPYWVPRGSLVKLQTKQGDLLFIAADVGGSVERRRASKNLGKTKQQRAAPVMDFCAKKQVWPDFTNVDVYYYAGRVPFTELRTEDQGRLFAYAKMYFPNGR